MVSQNDAAYNYVKQANAKEANRRLQPTHKERVRDRTSTEVLKILISNWMLWIALMIFEVFETQSLVYLIAPLSLTILHYPEWSRKRKAEKSG